MTSHPSSHSPQVELKVIPHLQNEQYPHFSRVTATSETRLKWTAVLHEKFVGCVNLLGGAENATPSAILRLMKSNELALHHVKSHLQKYPHKMDFRFKNATYSKSYLAVYVEQVSFI
ncbi:hypothetical protein V6N13_088463 [Hibiscus sabdariffa]|uniref:Myb-like domain-containing protein n=1 Tax=Hibiscus sabdariffa TaxID=183260 RepID=A0ABR2FZT4_9ROSI